MGLSASQEKKDLNDSIQKLENASNEYFSDFSKFTEEQLFLKTIVEDWTDLMSHVQSYELQEFVKVTGIATTIAKANQVSIPDGLSGFEIANDVLNGLSVFTQAASLGVAIKEYTNAGRIKTIKGDIENRIVPPDGDEGRAGAIAANEADEAAIVGLEESSLTLSKIGLGLNIAGFVFGAVSFGLSLAGQIEGMNELKDALKDAKKKVDEKEGEVEAQEKLIKDALLKVNVGTFQIMMLFYMFIKGLGESIDVIITQDSKELFKQQVKVWKHRYAAIQQKIASAKQSILSFDDMIDFTGDDATVKATVEKMNGKIAQIITAGDDETPEIDYKALVSVLRATTYIDQGLSKEEIQHRTGYTSEQITPVAISNILLGFEHIPSVTEIVQKLADGGYVTDEDEVKSIIEAIKHDKTDTDYGLEFHWIESLKANLGISDEVLFDGFHWVTYDRNGVTYTKIVINTPGNDTDVKITVKEE